MLISDVDAVLVTHRHVDLQPIRNTLIGFKSIVVWDNELGPNVGPFGRFLAACYRASSDVVYMQDDDCLTDPRAIVGAWEPGKVVCNMGADGHAANYVDRLDKLMGFGSCFERSLIRPTFGRYLEHFEMDLLFFRECGRIFTALNSDIVKVVEVKHNNLPWADAPDRMYREAHHVKYSDGALSLVKTVLEKENMIRCGQ